MRIKQGIQISNLRKWLNAYNEVLPYFIQKDWNKMISWLVKKKKKHILSINISQCVRFTLSKILIGADVMRMFVTK